MTIRFGRTTINIYDNRAKKLDSGSRTIGEIQIFTASTAFGNDRLEITHISKDGVERAHLKSPSILEAALIASGEIESADPDQDIKSNILRSIIEQGSELTLLGNIYGSTLRNVKQVLDVLLNSLVSTHAKIYRGDNNEHLIIFHPVRLRDYKPAT